MAAAVLTTVPTDGNMNIDDITGHDPSHDESFVSLADFHENIKLNSGPLGASSDEEDSSSDEGSVFRLRSNASFADSDSATEALTGRQDTRIAYKLRLLVIALFVSMAVFFPLVMFLTTRANEVERFDASFDAQAAKVVYSMEFQLARMFGAIDALQIAVTSHAQTTNSTWPFVVVPDYDFRAESARDSGGVTTMNMHPLVTLEKRAEWEEFSVNNIGWLEDSQGRQRKGAPHRILSKEMSDHKTQRSLDAPDFSLGFSKQIFTHGEEYGLGYSIDESDGPYFPTWQSMPPIAEAVNLNALSYSIAVKAIQQVKATGNTVISRLEFINSTQIADGPPSDYYNLLVRDFLGGDAVLNGPVALVYYPIFDTFDPVTRELVGMFSTVIYFEQFFTNILPQSKAKDSVICVVENECGDVFSYKITYGDQAQYLGPNDHHDNSYDDSEIYYDFSWVGFSKYYSYDDEKTVQLDEDYCAYSLRVYPDDDLYEQHVTNQPIVYAISIALIVVFISAISLAYDFFVQRRMRRAVKSAKDNRKIVSSLFPANVRDRLIQDEDERKRDETHRRNSMGSKPSRDNNSNDGIGLRRFSNDRQRRRATSNDSGITDFIPFGNAVVGFTGSAIAGLSSLAPDKLRLKFFLNQDNSNGVQQHQYPPELGDGPIFVPQESKPIADLFSNCTVMFADIAGFTAWSSEREPEQVFTLLQAIFQKFDTLARKRDIFKVETIGDCYVAVTGLPDPQPDHAVRMTKFSRACMHKVAVLTKKLEVSLGPGTGDLRMRFGLHSGPVTGGVLRGEKSRFQLFGDTVNTASRMESTGQRNRIQVSQSTAELLIVSGKENWIEAREDVVHAKGKGAIQTYWVLITRRLHSSVGGESLARPKFIQSTLQDSNSDLESICSENASIWGEIEYPEDPARGDFDLTQTGVRSNYDSLIDWQVDLLLRLLKQIIAGRTHLSSPPFTPADLVTKDCVVFEEISESIELPKFDPKAARARAGPNVVEVPDGVVRELRNFVRMIANRYRGNPFHNFEHANHVSMSANKLLSRIVKLEDINYHRKSIGAIASDLHDYTYGITSDPLTQFAIMFSTLVHDIDHTGVSNGQRNTEEPELATKYHKKSVAEQNSIDLAWDLLMEPQFQNLHKALFATDTDVQRFRQLLVNLVMATDIFEKEAKEARNMRWEKVFHTDLSYSLNQSEFRSLKAAIVIEHIIQAADVSHTMQHWQVYTKWNECLFQEMYCAYEDGRAPKDPSEGWYKGELWFFDNYVIPLARKLEECGLFGVTSDECLDYALENRKEWEVKGKQIVAEMTERVKSSPRNRFLSLTPVHAKQVAPISRRSATSMVVSPKHSLRESMIRWNEKPEQTLQSSTVSRLSRVNDEDISIEMPLNDAIVPLNNVESDGTSPRIDSCEDQSKNMEQIPPPSQVLLNARDMESEDDQDEYDIVYEC